MKIHDSYDQPIPSSTLHSQMEHIIWHNVHHKGVEAGFKNVTTMFKPISDTTSCTWKTVHGVVVTKLEFGTITSNADGLTVQRSVADMYPLLKEYLAWLEYHTK